MHINNLHILYTILVVMIARAHCSQFMCYVCDDCSKVTVNTPKQICDETFFNKESTQAPAIITDSTTETISEKTTETTVSDTNQSTNPTTSTSPAPPTPPTIAPLETTTPLPTPPNLGTTAGLNNFEFVPLNETTTTTTTTIPTTLPTNSTDSSETTLPTTMLQPVKLFVDPAEIRMRQLRSTLKEKYTYHCYSVQDKVNGTLITSRGCSRIGPSEAVCTQLEQSNSNAKYTSCNPCSNTLCNSSNAVGASMLAMVMGLVVALLFKSNA